MPKKNDFKLDVVSVRLVKDAPIYSEHTFNNPADIAAVMGDCMCQFDREVVCVVNLRSDLKPINVHFASVGSLNEAKFTTPIMKKGVDYYGLYLYTSKTRKME